MSQSNVEPRRGSLSASSAVFSPQCIPFVTAIVKQNVSSLVMRYFLSSLLLRFVGAPLYMKWGFNILNFTWAAAYSQEWLGTFLGPDDPIGDVALIKGWLVLLQVGRFLCLYTALCKFLETQGTSMTEVWGSYAGYIHGITTRLLGSMSSS